MIQNGDNNSISIWYHEGEYKTLAHGIKSNDQSAIAHAAELLAKHVHKDFCLIPVPSHLGFATNTLELCKRIAELTQCRVCDALKGEARQSHYEAKKRGESLNIEFYRVAEIPKCKRVLLVDNVIHTAKTAKAARKALENNITILTLTISTD